MLVYRGEATDLSEMPEEEAAAVLGRWQSWMREVGSALVDVGAPFGPGKAVIDDGGSGPALGLSGYSIIEAADLDQAAALAGGHPFLSEGLGRYAIDLFELMPVPFDS
jgi:hypothetical protein